MIAYPVFLDTGGASRYNGISMKRVEKGFRALAAGLTLGAASCADREHTPPPCSETMSQGDRIENIHAEIGEAYQDSRGIGFRTRGERFLRSLVRRTESCTNEDLERTESFLRLTADFTGDAAYNTDASMVRAVRNQRGDE